MEISDEDLRVPENAGVWAPELAAMLARMTTGRALGCERGWYPILARMHTRILAVMPDYTLRQVKEKFGALRVYWSAPDMPAGWTALERDARAAAVAAIVREAEAACARTCEECGAPGGLWCTREPSPWYQTLCAQCAPAHFLRESEWQEWWVRAEPEWRARRRRDWLTSVPPGARVVAAADAQWDLPQAVCAHTPAEVVAALDAGGVEEVLLGPDECGRAAVEWLATRYATGATQVLLASGYTMMVPPPGAPRYATLAGDCDTRPLASAGLRPASYPGAQIAYGRAED